MREIKLSDINEKSNSAENREKDRVITIYVKSLPNYTPGRKRPRDVEEEKILAGFKRKK